MNESEFKKELIGLKSEQYNSKITLEANKKKYEKQLMNGLGEEIKKELINPTKPRKIDVFKVKFKLFLRRLFDIL